jgi:hypothetical protein
MPLFKSDKPVRIASLTGYMVTFVPGEPQNIPEVLITEALALGCTPVTGTYVNSDANLSADEREAELKTIITALIAKNDPKDFNHDGSPRVHAVRRAASFAATGEEIRNAFEALSLGG